MEGPIAAAHRLAAGHITRRSVWFQNSVRGGLGLSIAVLLAEVTEIAHGFWVVLGAMSVLRTTALTTGSTALRALGGTLVGFVAGAGDHPAGRRHALAPVATAALRRAWSPRTCPRRCRSPPGRRPSR